LKGDLAEHHSGMLEASQLMYKRPDLVRTGKLSTTAVAYSENFSNWGLYDLFGKPENEYGENIDIMWNSREEQALTSNGQFSPNKTASAATGKQYHDYMVKELNGFVKWMQGYRGVVGNSK